MIVFTAPLSQDKIIADMEAYAENGVSFTFKEKKGPKLYFEVTGTDSESGVRTAKDLIKGTDYGKILYFQVEAE